MARPIPELGPWVEREWSGLLQDGLRELRRIPSSSVQKRCCTLLSNSNKYDLQFLKRLAMDELSEPERLQLLHEEGQYDAFRHIDPVAAMMLEAPLSYLKSGLKQMLSQSIPENFRQLVVAHLQELGDAEAPKAPETRSAFDKKFKAEFGAKLKRSGFGTWHLPVRTCETDIKIEMDFGGFGPGFRYELLVAIPGPRHPARFSYEGMLGFLAHDWNLLRTDRLEEHADLLVHLVRLALDALASIEFERLVASRLANHQRE